MFEEICYKKPFLKEVIMRVDFSAPLTQLESNLPQKVANTAVERFPISEPRKAIAEQLEVSPGGVQRKQSEFTEWNFFGREREKRLVISPQFIFITVSRYTAFEDLKSDFSSVLDSIFVNYPDSRGGRFGLRYINRIELGLTDPFTWDEYISPDMLCLFTRFQERQTLARLFHIVDFKFDELNVRFQFGMPNPDFPAPIKQPVFVLDLDGYVQGLQDFQQISTNADQAHGSIQRLFEESITERLRGIMNA